MNHRKFDPYAWLTQKTVAVIAGLAIVELLALLSVQKFDWPLTLALYLLAIAIPALVGYLMMSEGLKTVRRMQPQSQMIDLVASAGAGLGYLTLLCILWHFLFVAAFIFVSVTMLMIVFVVYHVDKASAPISDE
jgi:hypothetical protein